MKPKFGGAAGDMLNLTKQAKFQLGVVALTMATTSGGPAEKAHAALAQAGTFMMVAGMRSNARQQFWQSAILMAPHMPDMGRGFVQGYRGVLEARTMASIPFSYSTLSQDIAFSSMQYGQQRLNETHSILGSEAAMMAARYMVR